MQKVQRTSVPTKAISRAIDHRANRAGAEHSHRIPELLEPYPAPV
jgi:hypothetical protein